MKPCCPTCERAFEKFEDYPRAYVEKVEIMPPITDDTLALREGVAYAGPRGGWGVQAPKEVVDFFRNNKSATKYETSQYIWRFLGPRTDKKGKGAIRLGLGARLGYLLAGGSFAATRSIETEDWETASYDKSYKLAPSIREGILQGIKPYLDSLESLVGKEVKKSDLLPPFERDKTFTSAFDIPGTAYHIGLGPHYNSNIVDVRLYRESPDYNSWMGHQRLNWFAILARISCEGRPNKVN